MDIRNANQTNQIQEIKPLVNTALKYKTIRKIIYLQPCSDGFISYFDTALKKIIVYDPQNKVEIAQFMYLNWTEYKPYYISLSQMRLYKSSHSTECTYDYDNNAINPNRENGCVFGFIGKYLIFYEKLYKWPLKQYIGTQIKRKDINGQIVQEQIVQEEIYSRFQSFHKMYLIYSRQKLQMFLFNDKRIKYQFKDNKLNENIIFLDNNQFLLTTEEPKSIINITRIKNLCKLIRRIKVPQNLRFQKSQNTLIILSYKPLDLTYVFSPLKHRLLLLSSIYLKDVSLTKDKNFLFFTLENKNLYTKDLDNYLKQLIC